MLINASSIEELNGHLPADKKPTDERNWRGNILIEGGLPYDETKWQFIRINKIVMKATKPCTRCQMPSIDPDNGTKDAELGQLFVEYVHY